MKHATSFFIKLLITTVILWIVLGIFFDVSFGDILLTSIILSAVAYLGDRFILPNVDNFWATIGDFGLSFISIYIIGQFLFERNISIADAALLSALFIAVGEIFYHRYMKDRVLNNKESYHPEKIRTPSRMLTEFSSEITDENHHKED
jgi:hypothetical protein